MNTAALLKSCIFWSFDSKWNGQVPGRKQKAKFGMYYEYMSTLS